LKQIRAITIFWTNLNINQETEARLIFWTRRWKFDIKS